MFNKFILDFETNLFDLLEKSTEFEDIAIGRKGTNLVDVTDFSIPIVRTTTNYNKSAQKFLQIHYNIVESIKIASKTMDLKLNNALIEIYDSKYTTMGYHSDQALDLEDNSYICIFSCYNNPNDLRKLKVRDKITKQNFDIILDHNSVIMFSVHVNSKYLHKIILESNTSNNKWLGITFRQSKTFVQFNNEIPFLNNAELRFANDKEKKEFFKLRKYENSVTEFTYPKIDFTISKSDLIFN